MSPTGMARCGSGSPTRAPPHRATFMRMLRGRFPGVEDAGKVFALAGPELA